jgi:Tfp pilus assembly protein FimV
MATFLVLVAVTAARLVGGFFTDSADAAAATGAEGPVVAVVQPGDTLWTIAADLDADGELRSVVDALVELNGSSTLTVGQRLVLPPG